MGASTSCQKDNDSKPSERKKRAALKEVVVEIRENNLAYLPGSPAPYTGESIELHYDRQPPSLARRAPYLNGKKHGVVTTYTSGGKLREERRFENGRPISSNVYHGNGQKKIEVQLNEKNLAEGPYKRWHDNGVLQSESNFDADELFHGEEKNYDREGILVGHYRKNHGVLVDIIFETSEMRAERLEKSAPATPTKP